MGSYTYLVSNGEVTITGFLDNNFEADIPAYIEGKPVTKIGRGAFAGCDMLDRVYIPETISSIISGAFAECHNLETIQVSPANRYYKSAGDFLYTWDMSVLKQCPGAYRGQAYIPNSVSVIDQSAFAGCKNMTEVTIPEGVSFIAGKAFEGCQGLTNVSLPDSVAYLSYEVFADCDNLRTVWIGRSMRGMGSNNFYGCDKLQYIVVNPANASFASSNGVLFDKQMSQLICYPSGKAGDYSIPDTVTYIERDAFRSACLLRCVTVPASVDLIGSGAFSECGILCEVFFEGNLPYMEESVFQATALPGLNEHRCTPEDVVVYHQYGKSGWSGTIQGLETRAYGSWGPYLAVRDGDRMIARTGDWLGDLDITLGSWVRQLCTGCFIYIPESEIKKGKGWVYIPDQKARPGIILSAEKENYGWSCSVCNWSFVHESGWVQLL